MLSLGTSWLLVSRLERVGARLGLSEALLGVLAALVADMPEVTAAVTALVGHQSRIGAGVVIGSNVFNLAALLGLAAIIAGRIALHRRVVVMEGVVALWVAAATLAVVVGLLSPAVGLAAALALLLPYLVALGVRHERLRQLGLPAAWVNWLANAITEEEIELEAAIHPRRGRARDAVVAAVAVLVVVGASVAMEQAASKLGTRHAIPEIVVGGLILAGVTSLPNAVAAVYLATRGRDAQHGNEQQRAECNRRAVAASDDRRPQRIVGTGDARGGVVRRPHGVDARSRIPRSRSESRPRRAHRVCLRRLRGRVAGDLVTSNSARRWFNAARVQLISEESKRRADHSAWKEPVVAGRRRRL